MRLGTVVAIVIGIAALIIGARGGFAFALPMALPGLGGPRPLLFELGSVAVLLITGWGIRRLYRDRNGDE